MQLLQYLAPMISAMLCSLVPCDPQYTQPVISRRPDNIIDLGNRINENEISEFDNEVSDIAPIVNTTIGSLEGYMLKTVKGNSIYGFEGIPFAEPPVGFNRFRNPVPKIPWKGLRSAKKPGAHCMQLSIPRFFRVIGEENCLFLNIFTPALTFGGISPDLPVVVFIHGGLYSMGAGSEYGPSYILDQDVILVTINFRLGVLGFLSTGDLNSPGNWGLKDQTLALKWINQNIRRFGGDPNKVTLMGHQSGGAMVHLHMISTKTRDYFQSVVSLSGTAMTHWAVNTPETSTRWTYKLANLFGCSTFNTGHLMNCLDRQSSINLVSATLQLYEWFSFPAVTFGPVVEPYNPDAFLTEMPETAYKLKHVAQKPWIATRIQHEGYSWLLMMQSYNRLSELQSNWKRIAPYYLAYDYNVSNASQITDVLTRVYFGPPPFHILLDQLSDLTGDRWISYGLHKSLEAHSQVAPTYAYLFTYKGAQSYGYLNDIQNSNNWGAINHLEDVFLYFNASNYLNGLSENDPDYQVSKVMINLLQNFAKRGEPLISDENGKTFKIWEPISNVSDMKFLKINEDLRMIAEPFIPQIKFWELLGLGETQPSILK